MPTFDTRDIAPYSAGHFIFRQKWKELERVHVTYVAKIGGRAKIRYTFEACHSLLGSVCYDLEIGQLRQDHAAISYFMGDVLGAIETWKHVCRVNALNLNAKKAES